MPIIKRFEVNLYLGDFEEIDEHPPFFDPNFIEEDEVLLEEKEEETTSSISIWERGKTILKSFFSKS